MSKSKTAASKKKSGARGTNNFTKLPKRSSAELLNARNRGKLSIISLIPAFLIPALLTLAAYAFFKVYPFGDRSVLTLDLNGQYVYYFEALRKAFWGDGSIFYNWSRNLSGGFMGIIGYYLASPFTLIVMLLPKKMMTESIMIMQILKVGAAGLTFSLYAQRSKNVKALQSILFSTGYAMMSYVAIQLIDPMWIDGPIFLPLIILGVEYLIDDGRKLNYIIPLALMFIANFYIGYMVAIFVAIYFVYYLFFGTGRKFKDFTEYIQTGLLMVAATVVVMMCSAIMILPVYNALKLGKFNFTDPVYDWSKHLFKLPELVATLMPNQYYSVNVDEGTGYYGRPEIYCGVLTVVMLPLFYMNKNIKRNRKIGYSLMLFVMYLSMYEKPINMMWHGGQDPNWLPYRYSFIISFILVSMAADCFGNLDGYKLSLKQVVGTFAGIFAAVFIFAELMPTYKYSDAKGYKYAAIWPYTAETGEYAKQVFLGTLAIGVLLAAAYLAFVYSYNTTKNKGARTTLTLMVACVVFFEAGYNAYDTFRKIDMEVSYQDRITYEEIMNCDAVTDKLTEYDDGFYRSEKTYNRMVNDDIAYGIKGLSHSSSVMNTKILKFLEAAGYFTQSFESKYFSGNTISDSLLGVKYVIDSPDDTTRKNIPVSPYYTKLFSSSYKHESAGQLKDYGIDYYENPYALSLGYAADDDILKLGALGNDNPFNSVNNYLSSLTGNTADYSADPIVPKQYFVQFLYDEIKFDEAQVYQHTYTDPNGTPNDPTDDIPQNCYEALAGSGNKDVNVHITAPVDGDYYVHVSAKIRKSAGLYVSTEKDENGNFINHQSRGMYFDTNSAPIVRLGNFTAGQEIEVRFAIQATGEATYDGHDDYIMTNVGEGQDFQFAYIDMDAFSQDIATLNVNPWVLDTDKTNDRYLEGTVNIGEGQIFATSIPYEPGWTIKVDGKKVDSLVVETKNEDGSTTLSNKEGSEGVVEILNAMIGIKLAPGKHTITMKYTPPGFNTGVVTLILGIGVLVYFFIYDRKHNKVLIERRKEKERKKNGEPADETPESSDTIDENGAAPQKTKVQIIKSKAKDTINETVETDAQKAARERAEAEAEKLNEKNQQLIENGEKFIEGLEKTEEKAEEAVAEAEEKLPETVKPNNNNNTKKNSGGKKKHKKKK